MGREAVGQSDGRLAGTKGPAIRSALLLGVGGTYCAYWLTRRAERLLTAVIWLD